MNDKQPYIIIKLGGSVLVPTTNGPDVAFLKNFIEVIKKHTAQGKRFCIIIGGGAINKMFNDTLNNFTSVSHNDLDWVGIFAIRFNAMFVKASFGDSAHNIVLQSPNEWNDHIDSSIVICGAEAPGHSSNYDSVAFAAHNGSHEIINLSNINYVCDKDPRTHNDAQYFSHVLWSDYLNFIPKEWTPKLSTPFDPVASRKAQELDLEVVFMKGNPVDDLDNFLTNNTVNGTRISNNVITTTISL